MNERKILLTAFEPFDATGSNSSLEVLKRLELPWLETAILPVSYRRAAEELTHLMEEKLQWMTANGVTGYEAS